ncbi:MAG TPA: hypothetical protein VGI03_13300 [Verrucomicrobiae bacterium]|jgi:hypothetical protein
MFDLEKSITEWRAQMLAAGIKLAFLEELEGHLRDEISRQASLAKNLSHTFDLAVKQIGCPEPLACEFKKIEIFGWNRPLAWTAWIVFVASFFLPAIQNGWGWQCAGISLTALSWSGPWNFGEVYLASLTLANLLMIASPWLLVRFSQNSRSLKWLRFSFFGALALVWSYILLLVTHMGQKGVMLGCYLWGFSFLLLCLSTVKFRSNQKNPTQYV